MSDNDIEGTNKIGRERREKASKTGKMPKPKQLGKKAKTKNPEKEKKLCLLH
jgi:hypothetical protein